MEINLYDVIFGTLGGIIIGISAYYAWHIFGRIMGVSGIISNLKLSADGSQIWRYGFLTGLIVAGAILGVLFPITPLWTTSDSPLLIAAGILVGAGTVIGSGCTSGHGVCGISRFSVRSIAAVVVFMATGMMTVTLVNGF